MESDTDIHMVSLFRDTCAWDGETKLGTENFHLRKTSIGSMSNISEEMKLAERKTLSCKP